MKNKIIAMFLTAMPLMACSDDVAECSESNAEEQATGIAQKTRVTATQAEEFARLFAPFKSSSGIICSNKGAEIAPLITSSSCLTDGTDTLLYAFNYGDGDGFSIVGGSLTSFHIIAQADSGRVDLDALDRSSSFFYLISQAAKSVQSSLSLLHT